MPRFTANTRPLPLVVQTASIGESDVGILLNGLLVATFAGDGFKKLELSIFAREELQRAGMRITEEGTI